MSIRTTVTLEEDVFERVKQESRSRDASFKDTLNALIRAGLSHPAPAPRRKVPGRPMPMGQIPGLNYDDIEGLIEYAEGPYHR